MSNIMMRFPEGKKKAFTTSYDDGIEPDIQFISLLNQHGIKGTFNINFGLFGKREQVVIDGFDTDIARIQMDKIMGVYNKHEIACHGFSHKNLVILNKEEMENEIIQDRKGLESLTKHIVDGFAYPYGTYNDEVIEILKKNGIVYARTVNNTEQFTLPTSFMNWNPTCHHNCKRLMELADKFCNSDEKEVELFYLWGHTYEFEQRKNWYVAEKLFTYLDLYRESIWMATNGEIFHYIKAYQKLQYSLDESYVYNPTSQRIWIEKKGITYCICPEETIKI